MKVEVEFTKQDIALMQMVADGLANKEIAASLNWCERKVKFHLSRLFVLGNCYNSRVKLAAFALRNKLVK